jgi:hypothetical protein
MVRSAAAGVAAAKTDPVTRLVSIVRYPKAGT